MSDTTTRFAIIEPSAARTDGADVPFYVRQIAQALEAKGVLYGQGTLAARPAFGVGGRFYYATDQGKLYWDAAGSWVDLSPTQAVATGVLSARPTAVTALNGTWYYATDQVATYLCVSAAWVRTSEAAGTVSMTLGAAQAGHVLLQGQAWPGTTGIYADLFALLGGGALPDFGGFAPVGFKSGDASFGTLGSTLGEKAHQLTAAELASHAHSLPAYARVDGVHTAPVAQWGSGGATGDAVTATDPAGSDTPHNNIQPSKVVNFQAKL